MKKLISLLIGSAIGMIVVAGCSGGDNTDSSDGATAATSGSTGKTDTTKTDTTTTKTDTTTTKSDDMKKDAVKKSDDIKRPDDGKTSDEIGLDDAKGDDSKGAGPGEKLHVLNSAPERASSPTKKATALRKPSAKGSRKGPKQSSNHKKSSKPSSDATPTSTGESDAGTEDKQAYSTYLKVKGDPGLIVFKADPRMYVGRLTEVRCAIGSLKAETMPKIGSNQKTDSIQITPTMQVQLVGDKDAFEITPDTPVPMHIPDWNSNPAYAYQAWSVKPLLVGQKTLYLRNWLVLEGKTGQNITFPIEGKTEDIPVSIVFPDTYEYWLLKYWQYPTGGVSLAGLGTWFIRRRKRNEDSKKAKNDSSE